MAQEHPDEIRDRYGLTGRTLMDRVRENWEGYVFIIPLFIAFGALFYFPILRGIWITFTDARLGGGGEFVGLENYIWIVTNDLVQFSIGWTLVFVLTVTFLQLIIGLAAALLLHEIAQGVKDWLAALIMAPYFSAPLAGGVIWFWYVHANFGLIPRLLTDIIGSSPSFLAGGIWPYLVLIVAQGWHDYAYAAIIYGAALVNVPKEQYEAAAMSGAGRLRRFRDVTVPHLLIPTIIILSLRTAWNVAEFAQPFELTGGGPGTRTMLLSILTYETAYVELFFGRAFTIGMVMIAMAMIAAIIYITAIKEEEELYV